MEIEELKSISGDNSEIEYRFSKSLEFGTAGMRGLLGLGTNMMNVYTVRLATQGLAEFIKSCGDSAKKRGVVISYDTRRFSKEFAYESALVLASNGIKTYLFSSVHPVPMLSFAVKSLKTFSGIMITASHNPKTYNGYKVYGEDGAQLSPENTDKVVAFINAIGDPLSDDILRNEKCSKKIIPVSKSLDKKYYKILTALSLSKKEVKKYGKKLKIVYTPLHGSGFIPVTSVLKKIGISPILVPEQVVYDTEFSTVKVPNPELSEALSLAITMADLKQADVVFGTDPDCDRLGVAIRNNEGKFVSLSGNQTGILLLDYVLSRLKSKGELNKNSFVVKSFVTTSMANLIAQDYGVTLYDVPVGFKFIGEKIKLLDDTGISKFQFGFEESCGYLRGTHARDKDAVVASMLFAEMVCYYSSHNVSVFDKLTKLYAKYGFVFDTNECTVFNGVNAMRDMTAVVNKVKKMKIDELGGIPVEFTRDYSSATVINKDGSKQPFETEKVNALYFGLLGGSFVCIRPSGTEPKLKVYFSVKAETERKASMLYKKLSADFKEILNQ